MRNRRAPVPLAGAIERLTRRLEPDTPLASIQRLWPSVVGDVIAAETEPVAERGGTVTVSCRSAVWAQELTFMAPDLVQRLNEALGSSRVVELRCRAIGPLRGGEIAEPAASRALPATLHFAAVTSCPAPKAGVLAIPLPPGRHT